MGLGWGAWHRLRQEQLQPMQQVKHFPWTKERQVQPPVVQQCLQPVRSKSPTQQTNMPNRSEHSHQPFPRTHIHCRKYKRLSNTMEGHNPGPMGGGRIPDRIFFSTPSRQRLPNIQDGQTSTGGLGSRDSGSLKQRSSRKGQIRRTWLHQSDVCSPQEGRQVETNYQPKIPRPVRGEIPLQDGRHKNLKDILQGDQMAKLDLKVRIFSISIAVKHRKFPQFYWRNQRTLRGSRNYFASVLTFLRDKAIRCLMYLDDMLILGRTATELNHIFAPVKPLLTSLGFHVNEDKSVLGPIQELEFLGYLSVPRG